MIRHTNIAKRLVFDMEKIIAERDKLRAQLTKKNEALGAITKILKRGQAYNVARAELKEEE